MQVYKFANLKNYKLIITICKYVTLQIYKFAHLQT
jgi:hypothetical protein